MKKKENKNIKIEKDTESSKHCGNPMDEKSYKEWQRAFIEIEEISKNLKETKI
jgi:hypothetical protein